VFGEAAMKRIANDPLNFAGHVVGNIWRLWNTSQYPEALPAISGFGLSVVSAAIFLLAMLGVAFSALRIRGWPLSFGMAIFMLYPMIVHLPLHTEARYTAAGRPLLLMFAAVTLHWLVVS